MPFEVLKQPGQPDFDVWSLITERKQNLFQNTNLERLLNTNYFVLRQISFLLLIYYYVNIFHQLYFWSMRLSGLFMSLSLSRQFHTFFYFGFKRFQSFGSYQGSVFRFRFFKFELGFGLGMHYPMKMWTLTLGRTIGNSNSVCCKHAIISSQDQIKSKILTEDCIIHFMQ